MAVHPQVDLDVKERQSTEIAEGVFSGFADLGVLSDAVDTAGLTLSPFAVDRLVVVTEKEGTITRQKKVLFSDVVDNHIIGLASGALQDHLTGQAERLGIKLKMRAKLRSFDGICQLAAEGIGIGIIPEAAARRCRRSLRIAIVPLGDAWATRRLSICTRSGTRLPALVQSLVEHLGSDRTDAADA